LTLWVPVWLQTSSPVSSQTCGWCFSSSVQVPSITPSGQSDAGECGKIFCLSALALVCGACGLLALRRLLGAGGDGHGLLLRSGGFFGAAPRGCFFCSTAAGDALAERVHEVDDLALLRCGFLVLGDRQVLELGFDEFFNRDLVTVDELFGIELV